MTTPATYAVTKPDFRFREIGGFACPPVDGVDFRILASLHEDGLLSQAAIGRKVGLTGPAVAHRIARLKEDRALLGFRADLHPAVFRRPCTMHVLPGPFEEADVERALRLDDVVWVAWKVDGGMTVMTYGDTDVSALGEVAMALPGDGRITAPPSSLGRRVLAAVVADPRAGRDALAKQTGLSPKTCAKHRDAAITRGDLSILPVLGALGGEGAIVYHAAVFGRPSVVEVGATLQQAVLVNQTARVQYWFSMAPDLATAMQRQRVLERLGAEVRVTMNRTLVQNNARLIEWLTSE